MADADAAVTWRELWDETAREVGRPQARWLCETACGLDGDEFVAELERPATQRMVAHLDAMLARLRGGEPLQYVLGHWAFRHLDLMVDRRVLIPRPETEEVVEVALRLARAMPRPLPRPLLCADLGTGSGAIGLSLATELDDATVWLTDLSADALDVARANAAGIGRAAARVRVAQGSWFGALPDELRGALSLVVANPPYIADGDPAVEAVVHDWEPHDALYAGPDGLDAIRAIVGAAPEWLAPGGWLVLELSPPQVSSVHRLLAGHGMTHVEVLRDAAGRERIACAQRAADVERTT
jgi:release factor glutamine methyltransferase